MNGQLVGFGRPRVIDVTITGVRKCVGPHVEGNSSEYGWTTQAADYAGASSWHYVDCLPGIAHTGTAQEAAHSRLREALDYGKARRIGGGAVSYTHLTLPTILRV